MKTVSIFRQAVPLGLIYFALALLFLLRALVYAHTAPSISGDASSYLGKASYISEKGVLPELEVQPIGYPLALSLLPKADKRHIADFAVRIQQAMDMIVVLVLTGVAFLILWTRSQLAFLIISAVILIQPFTGTMSSSLYTEQMVSFFTFFGFLCVVYGIVGDAKIWSLTLGGILIGIASTLRVDILLLNSVIVVLVIAYIVAQREKRIALKISGLFVSLCLVPALVLVMQYASTGEASFIKKEFYCPGYMSWLRTWRADRVDYANFAFFSNWQGGDIQAYPEKAFADDLEKKQVSDLLSDWRQAGYSDQLDKEFTKIAEQKRSQYPIRYFLINPLFRMTHFWVNLDGGQFFIVPFTLKRPISTGVVGLALTLRIFLLTMFAFGVVELLRSFRTREDESQRWLSVLGVLSVLYVFGRTVELGLAGISSWGGLMEVRFVIVAFPFLIYVCIWGVRSLVNEKAGSAGQVPAINH